MRASEFLVEYRDRMYQYIRSIVPTWPEYIVKDWLYANQAKPFGRQSNITPADRSFATLRAFIPKMLADIGLTVDTKWQLVPNMKFTMDMWEPKTKQRLIARAGGKSTELVPSTMAPNMKDAERHATQASLAKQQGGIRKEPVIIIKTPQGYELLEGWHRTIQHFAKYPDGYAGPAYVAVATTQLDELFKPGNQNWKWNRRSQDEAVANFTVGKRIYVWRATNHHLDDKPETWEIQFRLTRAALDPEKLDLFGTTGTGNSAEVMSIVVDIFREFLQDYGDNVQKIVFDAKENSRIALYRKMIQRLIPNWDLDQEYNPEMGLRFILSRPKDKTVREDKLKDGKSIYRAGMCDAFAMALHQLTKLPLGAWTGYYYDDFEEDYATEISHICCVKSFDQIEWIDVDGLHRGKPKNLYFNNKIESIKLVPISEEDARYVYTMEGVSEMDIKKAKQFILSDPNLSKLM
jgi:hypothetical protein